MSANDEFFRSKKAAAVLKHGILKRYPVVFASKTGQGNPIVFLDGYAGRGEYDGGEPGSPLLLSRCAEFVQGFRDVLAFFVEQDPDSYANLEQVLREKGGPVQRELRQGSLDQHLPELLARAKGASLFAFLDPFGPALDFDLIRTRLLGRPSWPPTEVLLHFSVSAVARMGRAVHVAGQRPVGLSESERKTAARLDRFLGGAWWRDDFAQVSDARDDERATDIALRVADRYARNLTQGSAYQAVRMPVRPRPGLAPKYVLTLFTTHGEGAWHFADTLGKAGVEWEEAWVREQLRRDEHLADTLFGDGPVFDAEQYKAENASRWSRAIERNLVKMLEQHASFKIVDHVAEVYGEVLGHAWAPHVRQAVKALYRQKQISCPGTGDFWKEVAWRP
ncbi:three-Cys-motif partner protein TcmP [Micromonospora sp. WMMD998]|uniref:three-Cys-motif partner protein TcmP n=1 Tax=Micromonospora sp. WMMD998 TaxID=3016092 RepID=UPI00249C8A92|nr:three-Cys-motif partner protein TcmP [Micromonospora sp. WMMD998]WFE36964.1 three-Cys-motif partner protein TcmP [Micromonospora sp. WMMD998]